MAQADEFEVTVHGRGGHASQPNVTVDPVVVASHIVVAAQTIVSRFINPLEPAVVSFTTIHGGRIHNIIPDTVTMTGTVRTLDLDTQRAIKQRLGEVCEATCRLVRRDRRVQVRRRLSARHQRRGVGGPGGARGGARAGRRATSGRSRRSWAARISPTTCSTCPGAFAMLGAGDGRPYPHHNARFDIDEKVLPIGVRLMTAVALEMLEPK